jgi:hypothetical protein
VLAAWQSSLLFSLLGRYSTGLFGSASLPEEFKCEAARLNKRRGSVTSSRVCGLTSEYEGLQSLAGDTIELIFTQFAFNPLLNIANKVDQTQDRTSVGSKSPTEDLPATPSIMAEIHIPKTQKACIYDKPGTISTAIKEIDVPKPGPGEVLVNL